MIIEHDDRFTKYRCDRAACNVTVTRAINVFPYDWTEVKRHGDTYHFCFEHGLDVLGAVLALGIK